MAQAEPAARVEVEEGAVGHPVGHDRDEAHVLGQDVDRVVVGVGDPGAQTPVIVAEPWPEHWPQTDERKRSLIRELSELASKNAKTEMIKHFLLREQLPTDIRHNSKIFREQLVSWAKSRMKED